MTTIEFFDNTELSDISKVRIYDDLNGQNAFFNGLDKKTVQGQYKGFTDPLLIFEGIEDAVKYSYGRFQIGSYWYYFFVTDVQQDTATKSYVYYRLDYWETTRYQFNTSLGRGTLSRSSMVEPCATPYNAKFMKCTAMTLLGRIGTPGFSECDIVFCARKTNSNDVYYGYISGEFSAGRFTDTEKYLLMNGQWVSKLKYDDGSAINSDDIQGCWFSPSIFYSIIVPPAGWQFAETTGDEFNHKCIITKGQATGGLFSLFATLTGILAGGIPYQTNNTKTTVIKDLEGNVIYQCDYNRSYSNPIVADLIISPTSAKWHCYSGSAGTEIRDFEFTLPCSSMDFFIDSENEYFARERQFDIQTRELNSKKNLTSGIVSGGSTALSGAATGALVGSVVPGLGTLIGAGVGALAGALGGAITSGAQRGLDNVYNPQEQAIKDQYYQNAVDRLAIVGSNLMNFIMNGSRQFGIYEYEYDPDTKSRIESDIAEYGQYTSWAVPSGESYLGNDARLKGDFIVLGSIPESWKAGIQQRISTGVHVIKH